MFYQGARDVQGNIIQYGNTKHNLVSIWFEFIFKRKQYMIKKVFTIY